MLEELLSDIDRLLLRLKSGDNSRKPIVADPFESVLEEIRIKARRS